MNTKRWVALGIATLLVGVSILVNSVSAAFSTDWSSWLDDYETTMMDSMGTSVIEAGDTSNRIAVLRVDGVIQDTGSATSLLGSTGYNHGFFLQQLEEAKNDPTIKGIVLSVDSPGGGVVESAEIYKDLMKIKEETDKPIYVSMGGMAASGGYYIAAPADKIFVMRETMTGSIGVILQSINYGDLAEEYGVDFVTIKTGPYKDILSPSRDMLPEEEEMLQEMINDSYEEFVRIIAEGRGMSEEEVRPVADGRILNGRQAIEANLADDYGFEEDVIAALKQDLDLPDAEVFEFSQDQSLSSLFGVKVQSFLGLDLETQIISKLITDNQAPRMMYLYGEQ
ncbi:signal peptide peptidase SppA [Chryseomicrobium sp. FSL W7-1435]|uniref:signal peptide peptidase SppA n=1 Tax=Chryseomicrobium sp. FSL W7-1435 TaxID=2921704 RepID=UPI00315AF0BA